MIQIHSDYSQVEAHLRRLKKAPSGVGKSALEIVLIMAEAEMKKNVHVQTSSLQKSITSDSEEGRNSWTGTITAGGFSTGPKNPVDYAIYEQARDGDHDFTDTQDLLGPAWVAAIKKGLD